MQILKLKIQKIDIMIMEDFSAKIFHRIFVE